MHQHMLASADRLSAGHDVATESWQQPAWPGTFTGTISGHSVSVQGAIEEGSPGWNFSFTGMATCLLSEINTTDFSAPGQQFPSTMTWASDCQDSSMPVDNQIACIAQQIRDGIPQTAYLNPVPKGGAIPYHSGGGHGTVPGLFNKDDEPVDGLDCPGFTHIVYAIAYGSDVLEHGNKYRGVTYAQWLLTNPESTGSIGDLVFFTKSSAALDFSITHVGINLGNGFMMDEPTTGKVLRAESISGFASKEDETASFRQYFQYNP